MIQTIIGKKIDQSQRFLENGKRVPVTEVLVQDNMVVQVKTLAKDKYAAIQLGFGSRKKPTKALLGHSKKANLQTVPYLLREVRLADASDAPVAGDMLSVDTVLKEGDIIAVTGTAKGKGFAGGVKRFGFRGGPRTHGQSDRERAPGSIGQTTTPGRVYKGKRMAGHMGTQTVTVKNMTVVAVDPKTKTVLIDGLLPGSRNSYVVIEKIGEVKKFVPLLKAADETPAEELSEVAPELTSVDTVSEVPPAGEPEPAAPAEEAEKQSEVKEENNG